MAHFRISTPLVRPPEGSFLRFRPKILADTIWCRRRVLPAPPGPHRCSRGEKKGTRFRNGARASDLRISRVDPVVPEARHRCSRLRNSSEAARPMPSRASRTSIRSEAPGLNRTTSSGNKNSKAE
eukprot:scaffold697_cov235-Pinguiococcus_pyrenoidosus.AAC.7